MKTNSPEFRQVVADAIATVTYDVKPAPADWPVPWINTQVGTVTDTVATGYRRKGIYEVTDVADITRRAINAHRRDYKVR